MKPEKNKNLFVAAFSFLMLAGLPIFSMAGVESVSKMIKGNQVAANAVISIEDLQFNTMDGGAPGTWTFDNKNAEGWLTVGVDRANTTFVGSSYDVDLVFSVVQWNYNYGTSAFVQGAASNYTLQVSYNPTAATNEVDRSANRFASDVHKLSITLLNVYQHGTSTPVSIPQNLYVEGVLNAERYHDFDETADDPAVVSNNVYDLNADGFKDELEVHWTYISGAEEYDLEWTFINDYHKSGSESSAQSAGSIPFSGFDFEHNCTRVRVTDQHYRIPLLMDRGYVVYRVRGIGRGGTTLGVDFNKVVYGKWSTDLMDPSALNDVGDIHASHRYYVSNSYPGSINGGHEKEKNWQVTTTFAEDGKKKEVISYFDGTLRNRQTVTRVNTVDSIALIGETVYDNQGRAAIQTLPAPSSISASAAKAIKFYPFFNVASSNQWGTHYNRGHFDNDPTACTVTVTPMDSAVTGSVLSGASRYYSSLNSLTFSHRDYLPSAKGYPFTMVEYEPDNTNRIRTQTGVGKDHTYGSGHETKYFYGQPEQEQIDRFFASEAGYSQHYKKNMVVDANGQVSVTYLDMQGRTIATSLAGDTIGNPLNALDNPISGANVMDEAAQTLTVDLLSKVNTTDKNTPFDNNILSPDSTTLTYSAQKLVSSQSQYDFYYSLTAPSFTATCSPDCYPPVYNLDIHVKDQCGNEKLVTSISSATVTTSGYNPPTSYHDCNSLSYTRDAASNNLKSNGQLPAGAYTVEKVLKVDMNAVDILADQYMLDADTSNCLLTYYDFLDFNLDNEIHDDDCNLTCTDCINTLTVTLGTRNTYTASAGCAANPALCGAQWDAIYEECTELCKPVSVCQTGYEMMLRDVSPNGQYGVTSGNGYALSVFNYYNVLPKNDPLAGTPVYRSWQYPYSDYLDEQSQPSLVEVAYLGGSTSSSSSYDPQVVSPGTNVTVTNGKYYTKPTKLVNLSDFLDVWEPSWAKSLVQYHPEYEYYKWCDPLGDICGSTFAYTNDEFDYALMTINSYTAATAVPIGTATVNLTDMSTFLSLDPFFNNGTSACTTSYGGKVDPCTGQTYATLMSNAFNTYQTSPANMSMHKFAAFTALCGTWYASDVSTDPCPGYNTTFCANTSTRDMEWSIFKSYYMAKKQELMQRAADNVIADSYTTSPTADYNYCGCIGEPYYTPFMPCNYAPKNFYSKSFPWGSGNQGASDSKQPCSMYNFSLYTGKARRLGFADLWVPAPSSSSAITTMQNSVGYQLYQQTGLCPEIFNLKLWLNDMVKQSGFISSNIPLFNSNGGGIQGFTQLFYNALGGSATNFSSYTWTPTYSATTLSVTISPTPAGACSTGTVLQLKLPSTTSLAWNSGYNSTWKINSFTDISPINSQTFTAKAEVDDGSANAPIYLVLTGTVGSCIDLTACANTLSVTANTDCTPSDQAKDLQELMNLLSVFGDIDNTSGVKINDASDNPPASTLYKSVFGQKLLSYLPGPTSNTWVWKRVNPSSPVQYEITNTSYSNDKIRITLNTSSTIGTGTIFTNINSNPSYTATSTYNFAVDISGIGTSKEGRIEDITVGTSTVNISSGSCDYPNGCDKQEDYNLTSLEYLLNGLVTSTGSGGVAPPASGTTTVSGTKWFPADMHNYLSTAPGQSFGVYNQITAGTFSVNIKNVNDAQSPVFCTIKLSPIASYAAPTYSNIVTFKDLIADENALVNGQAFQFAVTYSLSTGGTGILHGTSCFPIKNCKNCIPTPNPLVDCPTAYSAYLTQIQEHLGSWGENPPPAFVMSQATFCNLGLDKCYADYVDYLEAVNCTTATQNTYITLEHFCQGNYGNCSSSYASFYDEIDGYLGSCSDLFVSLQDYCAAGIGSDCQTLYNTYFTGCAGGSGSRTSGDPLSIIEYCAGYPMATYCDPFPPSIPSYTVATPPDPCETLQYAIAASNAHAEYNAYIKGIKAQFKKDYIAHCMRNAEERFEMTYSDKEYHFTLYYYDQAGNLVRTIPPAGVTTLSLTAIYSGTVTVGQQIKNDRYNNTRNIKTEHKFPTTYRYNALNQLIAQAVPDNTVFHDGNADEILDQFSTRFWYDALGRLVVSQNSKQYNVHATNKNYSYTRYDNLGRTIEVGEATYSVAMTYTTAVHKPYFNQSGNALYDWIAAADKKEVTKTFYDAPLISSPGGVAQENLRNRVTAMTYANTYTPTPTVFDYGVHYDYDIHGNVKNLVQDNQELHNLISGSISTQRNKVIRYKFDLISGNVNDVIYESGDIDQLAHHYDYDPDNRITHAYTSSTYVSAFPTFQPTGSLWDRDAKYFYYPHGPLERVELGHHKVQGTDYAYTIQGWMKGVNSNSLKAYRDPGKDGKIGSNINQYIGSDEAGYSLNYFNADYFAIGQGNSGPLATNDNMFLLKLNAASDLNTASSSLYNGNIRNMTTSIANLMQSGAAPKAYAYVYDQLNRLKHMKMFDNADLGTDNEWDNTSQNNAHYREIFSYDHNGNIIKLKRNGTAATNAMDDFTKYWYLDANGTAYDPQASVPYNATNRLAYIDDAVAGGNYADDIDDQSSGNYLYDEIGNLKTDVQEQIGTIEWTVYGKVKKVTRSSGSRDDLEFKYDPSGNRICKIAKPAGSGQTSWVYTYYVRDAQGNTMATYKLLGATGTPALTLTEQSVYGSSRAAVMNWNTDVTTTPSTTAFSTVRGSKNYELSNHLGNVLAVVSDQKIPHDNSGTVDYYNAETVSANDYYSFGSPMPGRSFTSSTYRYGFNGMEKDDEVKGSSGTSYTSMFRQYDPRVGRWLSIDPETNDFPDLTPYNNNENNPIINKDPDGNCPWCIGLLLGAAVEYGSQVASNLIDNGGDWTDLNAYTNVDLADIAISAGEGALTGGASVITKTIVKEGVKRAVTTVAKQEAKALIKATSAEALKAAVDVKAEDGKLVKKVNTDAKEIVTKTVTNVALDKVGGVVKTPKKVTPQLKTTTTKEAVKTAKDAGQKLTTEGRLKVETKAGTKAARTGVVNKEIKQAAGKTASGTAAEQLEK